jgi:hypothetical protein
VLGSLRTLTLIALTALIATALSVRWSAEKPASVLAAAPGTVSAAIPVSVHGTLIGADAQFIAVQEAGGQTPVAFTLSDDATLLRAGNAVSVDALQPGDGVRMTIDGRSGQVLQLQADPVTSSTFHVPGAAALLAALGLIAGATALAVRNQHRLPTLPARMPVSRLLPVEATR